ncbi:transposable element Tc3 transposase [Trichonephila clavipes]|nr:transposable element Tc3 transposase [Trichonephila clavipes]
MHADHEMKPPDFEKKLHFFRWFRSFLDTYGICKLDNGFFTDEAWSHLHGYVNSQNSRYWSTTNSHIIQERPLHDEKLGVLCRPVELWGHFCSVATTIRMSA